MFNWRGEERDSGGIGEVEGKYGIGKEGLISSEPHELAKLNRSRRSKHIV